MPKPLHSEHNHLMLIADQIEDPEEYVLICTRIDMLEEVMSLRWDVHCDCFYSSPPAEPRFSNYAR